MSVVKGWVEDCSCGKCAKCRPEMQSAAVALFSGHKESGFSEYQGYAKCEFKKWVNDVDSVPTAGDKSDPPFEGRDAKQGQHGSPAPGTQSKGGIFRG